MGCAHGGKCVDGVCICAEGWTGVDCMKGKIHVFVIIMKTLLNGYLAYIYNCIIIVIVAIAIAIAIAIVIAIDRLYDKLNYFLLFSEDCIPKCENGGTCEDGTCTCTAGYAGSACERREFRCLLVLTKSLPTLLSSSLVLRSSLLINLIVITVYILYRGPMRLKIVTGCHAVTIIGSGGSG